MNLQSRLASIVGYEATQLCKTSVIGRLLKVKGRPIINDRVGSLRASPLGMYLYNQRAILYGLAGIYVLLLGIISSSQHQVHTERTGEILLVLGGGWLLGVVVTLARHSGFVAKVREWAESATPEELPGVYDTYFLFDSMLLLLLVAIGRLLNLGIDHLAFVLFANLVLYCTYIGDTHRHQAIIAKALAIATVAAAILMLPRSQISTAGSALFNAILSLAPVIVLMFATLLSASMISWLRTLEHAVTKQHLDLLGRYGSTLSDSTPFTPGKQEMQDAKSYEGEFRRRVRAVMLDLCSRKNRLWYSSGQLWLLHAHKDVGNVFVPYAQANMPRAGNIVNEDLVGRIRQSGTLLRYTGFPAEPTKEPIIDRALPLSDGGGGQAVVPLEVDDQTRGFLTLYGSGDRLAGPSQERAFLDSIGKILAKSIHQQSAAFGLYAQARISTLYSCGSLDELFKRAAATLRDCLFAEGSMIVFARNRESSEMSVVGHDGFKSATFPQSYVGPDSQTARCATETKPIRYDDVDLHRSDFNPQLLGQLEKNLSQKVRSWMAIPLGTQGSMRGAIKVINSNSRIGWFTQEDELLGVELARQLEAIIERRLNLDEIQAAKKEIQAHLQRTEVAQKKAESAARQRQDDIMIITHQLQGPLASVVGTLSELRYSALAREWSPIQDGLEDVREIIEDGIVLCYGIVTTFAEDAGRATSFSEDEIDAPRELELMAHRLRKTSARKDLSFEFNMEAGFRMIKMDRKVFTSVFYSLLHNAMKYADEHTVVVLECSRERTTGRSALKVKTLGEPIQPSEAERIFAKYERGAVVQRTGRHHSGVGLGLWVARQLMSDVGGTIRVELAPATPRLSIFVVEI